MDVTNLITSLLSSNRQGEARQTYTLGPGETLQSLAARLGASEAQILDLNPHLPAPSLVGPGDTLVLPFTVGELAQSRVEEQLLLGAAGHPTDPPTDFPPIIVTPPGPATVSSAPAARL